jgi:hypothetical protein
MHFLNFSQNVRIFLPEFEGNTPFLLKSIQQFKIKKLIFLFLEEQGIHKN